MSIFYLAIPRVTIAFVLGVLCSWIAIPFYVNTSGLLIFFLFVLLVLLVVAWKNSWVSQIQHRKKVGACLMSLSFLTGSLLTLHHKTFESENYFYQNEEVIQYVVELEQGSEKNGYWRGFAKVRYRIFKDQKESVLGTTYLTIENGNSVFHFHDLLLVKSSFNPVTGPENPGGFDMQAYLYPKGVKHTAFIGADHYKVMHSDPSSLSLLMAEIRNYIQNAFRENLDVRNVGVANALILGNKKYLENQTRNDFAYAGAMHILAVSGLHVGIVVLLVNMLIGHWRRREKYRWVYAAIGVICIWFYAFLTGLPVSVQRSALMFSLFVIGSATGNQQNTIHSVIASAFLLLLFNPLLLFDVGFQLSYAAVLGIIILQPKISNWFYSRYWFVQKCWEVCAVSIAAQLATLPFTMYYFGYFPVYFLVTNIIILPLTPLILILGLTGVAVYALSATVGVYFFTMLDYCLTALNIVMHWIASLPNVVIINGQISLLTAMLIAICVICLGIVVVYRQKRWFYSTLFSTIIVLVALIVERHLVLQKDELVIFKTKEKTLFSLKNGSQLVVCVAATNDYDQQKIKDYLQWSWVDETHLSVERVGSFGRKNHNIEWHNAILGTNQIQLEDQLIWIPKMRKVNLQNAEQVTLIWVKNDQYLDVRLLERSGWKGTIVLDPSNSFSHRATIKRLVKELPVDVHDIQYDGALVWSL